MIPKQIHYCWFGRKPLPASAKKCIRSWKKFLPDYEIIEWNEDNFDVNATAYTAEAYRCKKYAFVSDYARFKILYEHGGLYFDTDVEVIRPLDDIIAAGPFMGIEECSATPPTMGVAPGLGLGCNPGLGLGCNPGLGLLKELLEVYAGLHFVDANGEMNKKTIVAYTTELLNRHGLKAENVIQQCAGVTVYPEDYFNPKDKHTGKITLTANTRSIHHFDATWHSPYEKFKIRVARLIGPSFTSAIVTLKRFLR